MMLGKDKWVSWKCCTIDTGKGIYSYVWSGFDAIKEEEEGVKGREKSRVAATTG